MFTSSSSKSFLASLIEDHAKKLLAEREKYRGSWETGGADAGAHSKNPPGLVLDDLLLLQQDTQRSNVHFELSHLGTLFAANTSRSGRFSIEELKAYATMLDEFHHKYPAYELWEEAYKDRDSFVNWFVRLIVENSKAAIDQELARGRMTGRRPTNDLDSSRDLADTPPVPLEESVDLEDDSEFLFKALSLLKEKHNDFVGTASVQTLHKIFEVHSQHSMTFQAFLDMLQQVGEDLKLTDLDDEKYDEVVPVPVIRHFAEAFLSGFIDLMSELRVSRPPGSGPIPAPPTTYTTQATRDSIQTVRNSSLESCNSGGGGGGSGSGGRGGVESGRRVGAGGSGSPPRRRRRESAGSLREFSKLKASPTRRSP